MLKWGSALAGVAFGLLAATAPQAVAARREAAAARDPCTQIEQACRAAGFARSAGLRKDCVEPILQGRTPRRGAALPDVDPAVVAACKASTPPVAAEATRSVGGVAGSGPGVAPGVLPPVSNSDGLLMSQPVPLFTGATFHMRAMPDQQTPILRQRDGTYQLFVTGVPLGQPGGVISVFSTPDLTNPAAYRTSGPVLVPPQKKGKAATCNPTAGDDCADYLGMEAVFDSAAGGGLVGFYIADQAQLATAQPCNVHGAFCGQLSVATATAGGTSWTRRGPTLRGAPVPTRCPAKGGPLAFNQPAVIRIGADYYAYFALPKTVSGLAVARAPVAAGGLPGAWSVLSKGQWSPVPVVGGVQTLSGADTVVPEQAYVTMPWVSFNTHLGTYLMTMVTHDGFYYSKLEKAAARGDPTPADLAAQRWTAPQLFQRIPGGSNWAKCAETWENVSFVTLGASDNRTTGKDGYVILSVVPGWACRQKGTRSFDIASFSFDAKAPPTPPTVPLPVRPPPKSPPCPGGRRGCRQ